MYYVPWHHKIKKVFMYLSYLTINKWTKDDILFTNIILHN
jgi:hypothetical protein